VRLAVRSAIQSVERRRRKLFSGPRKKESTRSITGRRLRGQSPTVTMTALGPKSTDPNEDERSKEFAQLSSSVPRRLNDIAQRPPEMKEMPWSVKCVNLGAQREKILSMAQRTMMERELERAIARYCMLKNPRLPSRRTK